MINKDIKVGKDVLESLTTSMYEDHKAIFREYIQNSCDQIDKAVKLNILKKQQDGEIYISIDPIQKFIEIADNATGIKSDEVYAILANIALSNKNRDNERGFRGIGRLAGLGYCDELKFETSSFGENIKTIMTCNAKLFKDIINDRTQKEEASEVMKSIISETKESEKEEKHYFKVILNNVKNDELLDIKKVRDYLSMVAPVPMPSNFIYRNKIKEEALADNINLDEYTIYVGGEKLFKGYATYIKDKDNNKIDEIFDIEFIKAYDNDKNLMCWGWYGECNFESTLNQINLARGIRLRKGNIQIGLERTLVPLHKEERGNNYFIGEIHAISKELIPNARRDYFRENDTRKLFDDEVKKIFREKLYYLYRKANEIKNLSKKVDEYNSLQNEYKVKKEESKFQDKNEIKKYEDDLVKKQKEAEKAQSQLEKIKKQSDSTVAKVANRITKEMQPLTINSDNEKNTKGKTEFRTQKEYPRFDKKTQKILSKIYSVIDLNLDREIAEKLKEEIKKELN